MDAYDVRKSYGDEELTEAAEAIQKICKRNTQYEKNMKIMILLVMTHIHDYITDSADLLKEIASRVRLHL
jgi:hypothetical protein